MQLFPNLTLNMEKEVGNLNTEYDQVKMQLIRLKIWYKQVQKETQIKFVSFTTDKISLSCE